MVEERMIEDPPPYVERDLLTGKALMIYWPHHWRRPIPLWPNFRRMGLIR
jgi:signal peptidase I